jgi:hypothetical protein
MKYNNISSLANGSIYIYADKFRLGKANQLFESDLWMLYSV